MILLVHDVGSRYVLTRNNSEAGVHSCRLGAVARRVRFSPKSQATGDRDSLPCSASSGRGALVTLLPIDGFTMSLPHTTQGYIQFFITPTKRVKRGQGLKQAGRCSPRALALG